MFKRCEKRPWQVEIYRFIDSNRKKTKNKNKKKRSELIVRAEKEREKQKKNLILLGLLPTK